MLLIGERGSGKELAALRLHYLSRRWQGPLVTLNCSALSSSLLESELFGHEKGAFTGATRRRTGRFESAHGGTLFLDEIGGIPLEVQEKILRGVEYNTFERVGSSVSIEVDVRVIAATHADLPSLSRENKFKQDLLDRLSFEVLFVPPLRERKEDILLLAGHFAARMAFELGRSDLPRFSRRATAALTQYPWPGNVRELKNVVERAVYRADASRITRIAFDPFRSPYGRRSSKPRRLTETAVEGDTDRSAASQRPFADAVADFKRDLLKRALQQTRYNQKQAAERLGLTYHQFRGLYRQFKDKLT